MDTNWLAVDCEMLYKEIFGKPNLIAVKMVIFLYQLMMKFSTERGIVKVMMGQLTAKECYVSSLKERPLGVPIVDLAK